jgi:hypothetical protein
MRWFGLNWTDIFINVAALAVIPGILAAYGGHLAAEAIGDVHRSKTVKVIFWLLFAFGILITFWQQLRLAEGDLARETKNTWEETIASKLLFPAPTVPCPSAPSPKLTVRPDIGMEFVNPGDVAFRMVNLSQRATLRDPKYGFFLIDIDGPRTITIGDDTVPQLLPIPAFADAGDFLKPRAKFMPRAIVSTFPAVQGIVKPNDRIFGSATVSCPDCIKDRTYVIFFTVGGGGWYAEIGKQPTILFRELLTNPEAALLRVFPLSERITIVSQ